MSLIVGGSSRSRDPYRRPLLIPIAVIAVAVVVAGFVVGLRGSRPDPAAPEAPGPLPALAWSEVGSSLVPSSVATGPRDLRSGLARGFSHDALGAAVAAINISSRVNGSVPQPVLETTVRAQCFGDLDATVVSVTQQGSLAPADSIRPSAYWFRLDGGDPTGDVVVVDIAASTSQSRALGAYVRFTRTLRWSAGDWQMQVPPARAEVVTSLPGYTMLGRP